MIKKTCGTVFSVRRRKLRSLCRKGMISDSLGAVRKPVADGQRVPCGQQTICTTPELIFGHEVRDVQAHYASQVAT